jgi:hypothetical protein
LLPKGDGSFIYLTFSNVKLLKLSWVWCGLFSWKSENKSWCFLKNAKPSSTLKDGGFWKKRKFQDCHYSQADFKASLHLLELELLPSCSADIVRCLMVDAGLMWWYFKCTLYLHLGKVETKSWKIWTKKLTKFSHEEKVNWRSEDFFHLESHQFATRFLSC